MAVSFVSVFLLLSNSQRLAETVFPDVVADLFGRFGFLHKIPCMVGAALSADIMLTTSVDLELALQQALAVRTGGQEVKGSHSRVGPFTLPVGGIVLCVMPVPLGFVRLSWTCPRLAFLPLSSDLLQVFLTCSTGCVPILEFQS